MARKISWSINRGDRFWDCPTLSTGPSWKEDSRLKQLWPSVNHRGTVSLVLAQGNGPGTLGIRQRETCRIALFRTTSFDRNDRMKPSDDGLCSTHPQHRPNGSSGVPRVQHHRRGDHREVRRRVSGLAQPSGGNIDTCRGMFPEGCALRKRSEEAPYISTQKSAQRHDISARTSLNGRKPQSEAECVV